MTSSALESQSRFSKLDKLRERELFRYYRPSEPDGENPANSRQSPSAPTQAVDVPDRAASPDATLTALAQLCALRLNASRAMVRYKP